jgi:hypothetical protein
MSTTTWASVVDAAAAMGCSVRTIQRRVASGALASRKSPDGQIQIGVPDTSDTPTAIVGAVLQQHDATVRMSDLLTTTYSELQVRHLATLDRVDALHHDLHQTRRRAWMGWSAASVACVTAVAVSLAMSFTNASAVRQADAAAAAISDALVARDAAHGRLAAVERELVELRHRVEVSASVAAVSEAEARHLSAMLSATTAERDRLADAVSLMASTPSGSGLGGWPRLTWWSAASGQ